MPNPTEIIDEYGDNKKYGCSVTPRVKLVISTYNEHEQPSEQVSLPRLCKHLWLKPTMIRNPHNSAQGNLESVFRKGKLYMVNYMVATLEIDCMSCPRKRVIYLNDQAACTFNLIWINFFKTWFSFDSLTIRTEYMGCADGMHHLSGSYIYHCLHIFGPWFKTKPTE